jgi:hypothetical protein
LFYKFLIIKPNLYTKIIKYNKKYEEKIEQNVKISNKKKLTKIDCTDIDDLNEKFIINEYESIETKNTYESTEYENITLM